MDRTEYAGTGIASVCRTQEEPKTEGTMDKKTIEMLNKPFADELIKQRPGPGGRPLSYVEGAEYIRRLNEAFGCEWAFDVCEHQRYENEIIVLGRLNAGGIIKEAFGGGFLTKNHSQTPVNVADSYKTAATDALKKAASLFGIGLHLYSSDATSRPPENTSRPPENTSRPPEARASYSPGASDKQIRLIKHLFETNGISELEAEGIIKSEYGHESLYDLTKKQASDLINNLNEK
jgi:hypothetical protein